MPQYRTAIDGLVIHFIHARSPEPDAVPLIMTHGWPGSFFEFEQVIEQLADPAEFGEPSRPAFHVVVPSLPGYGFSAAPTELGWNIHRIAAAWAELMGRLGYSRFVALGSDWGMSISTSLTHGRLLRAALLGEHCRSHHLVHETGDDQITVPTGCTVFHGEVPHPYRRWAESRFPLIIHWGEPERGGHFGAWEQPELFMSEVRAVAKAMGAGAS